MKKLFAICPTCKQEKLYTTEYNSPVKTIKIRNWLVCKNCDYAIQIEEFKKILFCAWLSSEFRN